MSKKLVLIICLVLGVAVSALSVVKGGTPSTAKVEAYGIEGNERPVFLGEIHALLVQNGVAAGLGPVHTETGGKVGPATIMSVAELAEYIDTMGITEDNFNTLIEQYFAPSPGVAHPEDFSKDTRPIALSEIHNLLVNELGIATGLQPIAPPYNAQHMLRVGALYPLAEKLGLDDTTFGQLIDLYFSGSGNAAEDAVVPIEGEDAMPDSTYPVEGGESLQAPSDWVATGEVYTDDLQMALFDTFGLDLTDFISELPSTMPMADFKSVAPEIGLNDDQVYTVYMQLLEQGQILDGNTDLVDGGTALYASVEDEPASTMSDWAVDGYALLKPYLPTEMLALIDHNPRGKVTPLELNQIVKAMYELTGTPSDQMPQWASSSVVRGEAIHVLVDAYLGILTAKGMDLIVATRMDPEPDLTIFNDYADITEDISLNVSIAYYKKWISGISDTELGVRADFERQQVIVIAYRILTEIGY